MTSTTASDGRTPMPGGAVRRALVRATVETFPSCVCGQALDTGHARYCPRCGVLGKC